MDTQCETRAMTPSIAKALTLKERLTGNIAEAKARVAELERLQSLLDSQPELQEVLTLLVKNNLHHY